MSSPLTVVPAEVVALAEGHDKVGAAVLADATTACVSGQMAAAYGPAGSAECRMELGKGGSLADIITFCRG